MYHIAVLTKSETQETFYREQLSRFCAERGLFPRVDCYRGQEVFFEVARKNAPTNAVISLPGVDGLNAVEHLRSDFASIRFCLIFLTRNQTAPAMPTKNPIWYKT